MIPSFKPHIFLVSLILLAGLNQSVHAAAADIQVVWQKKPISIALPVGKERLITFPSTVQFGYDAQRLPASILRVENDDHTVYLLAKQPFPTQRVEAKLADGTVMLLDIHAQTHANDQPLDVSLPDSHLQTQQTGTLKKSTRVPVVTLMRYAIQRLYAPKSVFKPMPAIRRFPMNTRHVVPLLLDGSAIAMPLASWQGFEHYVTAVLLQNGEQQRLRLNPHLFCGTWQAVSFYPRRSLAPKGAALAQDQTTVFVVSAQPFATALQNCFP